MSKFVFITDIHLKSRSSVRTGNYLDDLINKLDWVISYCNSQDASLLLGGDFFDVPSVSDSVKSRVISSLLKLKNPAYGISGNHDRLYDNPELDFKTSWNILTSTGLITDLDDVPYLNLPDVVLTSTKPILNSTKPTIALYHGFLNKEDGRNTFLFQDIQTKAPTVILLGHDHVEYPTLNYTPNVSIVRPGSFSRATRAEESFRTPQLVLLEVNGTISITYVPIKAARPYEEVFTTKESSISATAKHDSYEALISQLAAASTSQLTLEQALAQVAELDVLQYMMSALGIAKNEQSLKKNKL